MVCEVAVELCGGRFSNEGGCSLVVVPVELVRIITGKKCGNVIQKHGQSPLSTSTQPKKKKITKVVTHVQARVTLQPSEDLAEVKALEEKECDQPEANKGEKTNSTVTNLSSNTSLSQEEILAIKNKNHIEALRRLQKHCKLETRFKSSSSSNAPVSDESYGSVNLMIQQLRVIVFDVNLFKAIEEDANFKTDIHKLLKEINKQRILDSTIQFLFEFKDLFNHIYRYIQLRKTCDSQLQHKMEELAK
ncbi:unnamed protein product [Vicia faba]|uniref:Uncharacterized protein n=1 Tax=Vicia faba TaxID=3906 RepID=A0AAV0ZIS6_VICFA|nr:unnamed protein product [Vicia faba]